MRWRRRRDGGRDRSRSRIRERSARSCRKQRAPIEPAQIVARDVRAVAAELDAWPAAQAAMGAGVDTFGDRARAKPEGSDAPPVDRAKL